MTPGLTAKKGQHVYDRACSTARHGTAGHSCWIPGSRDLPAPREERTDWDWSWAESPQKPKCCCSRERSPARPGALRAMQQVFVRSSGPATQRPHSDLAYSAPLWEPETAEQISDPKIAKPCSIARRSRKLLPEAPLAQWLERCLMSHRSRVRAPQGVFEEIAWYFAARRAAQG